MKFWIWLGRVRTPQQFLAKLVFFVVLAGGLNHLRAVLNDGPDHHGFLTSFLDAAFVALPLGFLAMMLLARLGRLQDELAVLASTDTLTQLSNRRVFLEDVDRALSRQHGGRLLMADVDFFKRVNDTHGHSGGDICLQAVADMLRESCSTCHVARIGGEEFAVFLRDATADQAFLLAQRISRGISFNLSGVPERVTLSVGIAAAPPADGVEDMMHRADEALYFAKAQGRARAVDWDSNLSSNAVVTPHVAPLKRRALR